MLACFDERELALDDCTNRPRNCQKYCVRDLDIELPQMALRPAPPEEMLGPLVTITALPLGGSNFKGSLCSEICLRSYRDLSDESAARGEPKRVRNFGSEPGR